jgi:thiol-disulfide isomerase/thioredoxin
MNRRPRTCEMFSLTVTRAIVFAASFLCALGVSRAAQSSAIDLAGRPVDPLKSSPGKAVVLIFLRTDCPISNRYAPTVQRLSDRYAGKANFWLVYPARNESAELIRKHEQDFGYKLPALRDLQHALVKQSHAAITPEAAVFDADHRLIYHGRIDNLYEDFSRARRAPTTHELDDAIEAAIHGKTLSADTVPAVGCYISDLE